MCLAYSNLQPHSGVLPVLLDEKLLHFDCTIFFWTLGRMPHLAPGKFVPADK